MYLQMLIELEVAVATVIVVILQAAALLRALAEAITVAILQVVALQAEVVAVVAILRVAVHHQEVVEALRAAAVAVHQAVVEGNRNKLNCINALHFMCIDAISIP